ncbi:MAG: ABC transporter ATP-binding protein [Oscillospiraceae bacterium]|nr:ABC transporter ATP-binding protein [Oscillospiraceae bacterium]
MIEVINVSKTYGKVPALSNISFNVNRGEVLGIAGLNAAGKSTLISIISGILKPDIGAVLHENVNIFDTRSRPLKIGYVPQEIALFDDLSVIDNLNFWAAAGGKPRAASGLQSRDSRIKNALRRCSLEEHRKKKILTLSGGFKRRANIAAALVLDPDVLIMDEPTAGLDSKNRRDILIFIYNLACERPGPDNEPLTVIFTSHQAGEFELICNRIILLDKGKIAYDGNISQMTGYFSDILIKNGIKMNSSMNSITIDDILYMLGSVDDFE